MVPVSPRSASGARRSSGRLIDAGNELARAASASAEMTVAAAQTIGFRSLKMAQAAGDPVALADPEFTRMGQEKVEASIESLQAIAHALYDLGEAVGALTAGQSHCLYRAWAQMVRCTSPLEAALVQQRTIEASLYSLSATSARMVQAASKLVGAGMYPLHKKAAANARRLAAE
jgi:hypothetical protein